MYDGIDAISYRRYVITISASGLQPLTQNNVTMNVIQKQITLHLILIIYSFVYLPRRTDDDETSHHQETWILESKCCLSIGMFVL